MRRFTGLCGLVLIALTAGSRATAQEKKEAPSKVVAIPGGFRMYLVVEREDRKDERNRRDKLHDPVTEHGLFAAVGFWSRTIPSAANERSVAVMEKLEELAKKYQTKRLGTFTAFLALKKEFADDDERDNRIAEIKNAARLAKVTLVQAGLSEELSEQTAAWQLDDKDDEMKFKSQMTIVVYHRYKIVQRWDFSANALPTDEDLDKIAAVVEQLMGKVKAEPKKDEPKKDEPKKDEPKKDEPKKDEPKKDEEKK